MASASEDHLRCPVCFEVFQDPVILLCSHSFCRGCWQRWWSRSLDHCLCPVCKTRSHQQDPPSNLALRDVSQAFLLERTGGTSGAALCPLHSEKLSLFCLEHQEPVCVVCLHSRLHAAHSFSPVHEAAADFKDGLRGQLRSLQEGQTVLREATDGLDEASVELQAGDVERQIKEVFSRFQEFLRKEEQERLAAVREERRQKVEEVRRRREALDRELAAVSAAVESSEELLRTDSVSFLQGYRQAAQRVQQARPQFDGLDPVSPMDVQRHVTGLAATLLDSMEDMVRRDGGLEPKVPTAASGVTRILTTHFGYVPPLVPQGTVLPSGTLMGSAGQRSGRRSPRARRHHRD